MNVPRAAVGTVGSRLVAYALIMATGILIARILGPVDRGTYAVLLSMVSIVTSIGLLGVESANLYYAAQKSNTNSLVANSLGIGLCAGILLAGTCLLFFYFFQGRLFPSVTLLLAAVAVAAVPLSLLYSYLSGILWGLSRIAALNLLAVAITAIQFGAILFVAVFLKLGILELFTITFAVFVVNIAALLFLLKQNQVTSITLSPDWGLMRRMFGYSRSAYGANLFWMVSTRVDVILLNIIVGGAVVGHYAVAATMAQMMLLVPQSLARVLFVQFSGSSAEEANELVPLVNRTTVALMSGLALVAALVAAPGIRLLLGVEYGPSATLLLLLLPGVVASSLMGPSSSYISGRGRPDVTMRLALLILVMVISLDVVLIPLMGAKGAALAYSLANATVAAIQLLVILKWSKASLRQLLWPRWQDLRYFRSQLFARHP